LWPFSFKNNFTNEKSAKKIYIYIYFTFNYEIINSPKIYMLGMLLSRVKGAVRRSCQAKFLTSAKYLSLEFR
jgi:hypothetical protein